MYKLGFIGLGNMGSALVHGFVSSGFLSEADICGYDPFVELDDIKNYPSADEVINESEYIFICVKPQIVESVISRLKDILKNKVIVSIVLNYDFEKYEQLLDSSTRHVTIMPNTPVSVLEGMLLVEEKHNLTSDEFEFVKALLASVGTVEVLPSHLMKVGGALSGCGPAFIYMVIEALADGAVLKGLPRSIAYTLASQTVLGSGKMQLKTSKHPGVLKDEVTSPGGSTIKGVKALEESKIRSAFIKAIDESMKS